MSHSVLLAAQGLVKSYRRGPEEIHALAGATFDLYPGEVIALIGPSGSGKTTLLNLIVGWEDAESGSIEWSGQHVPAADRLWNDLSIVPQRLGLIEELSVAENIRLPLRLGQKNSVGDEAQSLMDDLGLAQFADRLPTEISLGEQQRTGLARALVSTPRLLLADEPTGHQDAVWGRGVLRTLRRAADAGTTSLIATHNEEVLKYVDRVLAIKDGHLHEEDVGQGRREDAH
ncbi:MAG TPA: ATP-binding cassette domain-containing protein [Actinomycetota bacterium]|nr:ATP-binding cassette domain-containing protein [Actinomycetota bacterium]